ncbi:MAG: FAD binding domain-containing protein, partial [Chloroflexi bacterium]|nr:FAD binding domain-containing protein [Chloroflexota bacterium]
MRAFEYVRPTALGSAVSLLDEADGRVRPLAGGTDLLPLMKLELAAPERLVDIKHLPELGAGIVEREDGLRVGALTSLATLASDPPVRERYTAL